MLKSITAIALAITLGALEAQADFVVAASGSSHLPVGQRIPAGTEVTVEGNGPLVLIGEDGTILSLRVGYRGIPVSPPAHRGMGSLIDRLILMLRSWKETQRLGSVRAGGGILSYDPWAVDVETADDHCAIPGTAPVLARYGVDTPDRLTIRIEGRDHPAIPWPRNQDVLPWPEDVRLEDGMVVSFKLETIGEERKVRFRMAPGDLSGQAQTAVWMWESGCGSQARRLMAGLGDGAVSPAAAGNSGPCIPEQGLTLKESVPAINARALAHLEAGRLEEAEPIFRCLLDVLEEARGGERIQLVRVLHNLIGVYRNEGRLAEAEAGYHKILAILPTIPGDHGHEAAAANLNLGATLAAHHEDERAKAHFDQAMAIAERLRPRNPVLEIRIINALAVVAKALGNEPEVSRLLARALLKAGLRLDQKDRSLLADAVRNMGRLHEDAGNFEQAERHYAKAEQIAPDDLPREHPRRASQLNARARNLGKAERFDEALAFHDQASGILRALWLRAPIRTADRKDRARHAARHVFIDHAATLYRAHRAGRRDQGAAQAFETVQAAAADRTAGAITRMAARRASGGDDLSAVVRRHQETVERWNEAETAIEHQLAMYPEERPEGIIRRLKGTIAELEADLSRMEKEIAERLPQYRDHLRLHPLPLSTVQGLLGPDEALVLYAIGERESFVWAVRPREEPRMERIAATRRELALMVGSLRYGLDGARLQAEVERGAPKFDLDMAWRLYGVLFAPVAEFLAGVNHLIVVPDGPLTELPFSVLVTRALPSARLPLDRFRDLPWLIRDHALSYLPAVSSLAALRGTPGSGSKAFRPLIGFGDPRLAGRGGRKGRLRIEQAAFQDPLPNSRSEMEALARTVGAGPDSVFLGDRATEAAVMAAPLRDYRIIAFATHGLKAGDLEGLEEPALALSPAADPGSYDRILLTAGEIAGLDLDADWVILSACNTAASDGAPDVEGFSGLARAFFFAGSRALLTSHWRIEDSSAAELTTRTLATMAGKPGIGRAEALRRASLSMLEPDQPAYFAHPTVWAPFVVVGDGGRLR